MRDAPFQVAATGAEGASRSEFLCHRDISDHTGRHRENTQIHGVAVYPTGDARPHCTTVIATEEVKFGGCEELKKTKQEFYDLQGTVFCHFVVIIKL